MTLTGLYVTVRVVVCGDFLVVETTAKNQTTMIGYYVGDSQRPAGTL